MKVDAPTAFGVTIELSAVEAETLYKIIQSAEHRQLNLEWPESIDEIDELVAGLQVQLSAVVGP